MVVSITLLLVSIKLRICKKSKPQRPASSLRFCRNKRGIYRTSRMIQSIGIDIVDIDRIAAVIQRWGDRFLRKILTPVEYDYCVAKAGRNASVAARFAAKEALYKALPPELQPTAGWLDIEVMNDSSGRPHIQCLKKLQKHAEGYIIHVSISHSKASAVAMVVLEKKGDER
jgi:holo-[acyl-carrier protein] synthase